MGRQSSSSSSSSSLLPTRILLIGYSYGSILCGSATSEIPECIGCVWIAPPFGVRHFLYMLCGNSHIDRARKRGSELPHLLIIGDNDNFTSVLTFRDIVTTMDEHTTTGIVLG